MRPSVKDLKFPFLRIFLHSIMCHKSMPLTIILWAPHRYRSRIWRHRSPDMPVCSSVRSSRFSLSAILSPERLWIHRSPGNPRAGSRPEAVLCGNRNPVPDHRLQKLPSRHRCGNTHSRHRRSSPCLRHIKAPGAIFCHLWPEHPPAR